MSRAPLTAAAAASAALTLAAWSTVAPTCAVAATVVTSPFRGVTHYHRTEPAGAVVPRVVVMDIVAIDLATPGISFLTTPGNGAAPGEFTAQTTSQFVQTNNLQIGMNGDFFSLDSTGPNGEIYRNVTNLAASNGELISPWPASPGTIRGALNVSANNVPTLARPASSSGGTYNTVPAITPYNTIGGSDRMIDNGNIILTSAFALEVHPRTVIGYNATKLFLFTVDGRQPGYSEGMNLHEIANVLKNDYGVTYALNLDGGGSTTLVMADPTRRVVNRPSDGTERFNGNNFGVFARLWPQWAVDAGGNWSTAGNWSDGVPSGIGHVAHFRNSITANRTITVNAGVFLGAMNFDSTRTYTIAGTQTVTLDTAVGNAAINVNSSGAQIISAPLQLNDATDITIATNGTLTLAGTLNNGSSKTINKHGGGTLAMTGSQAHGAGTVINVNAGTLSLASNAGTASAHNVTLNANGGTTQLQSRQNLAALNVAAAGVVNIAQGGARAMKTKLLTMAGAGKFDVGDNNLIVDYAAATSPLGAATGGVYSGIAGMIQRGRGNDHSWTHAGINSSRAAAADGLTGLAIAEASGVLFLTGAETATWSGHTVDATSVLVMYTYDGDANLDGLIDAADYGVIDNWIQFPGSAGYAKGDFNYDGIIDAGDYGIIDNNIQLQGPPLTPAASSPLTAVPEPSAIAALALLAAAAAIRPRHRCRLRR